MSDQQQSIPPPSPAYPIDESTSLLRPTPPPAAPLSSTFDDDAIPANRNNPPAVPRQNYTYQKAFSIDVESYVAASDKRKKNKSGNNNNHSNPNNYNYRSNDSDDPYYLESTSHHHSRNRLLHNLSYALLLLVSTIYITALSRGHTPHQHAPHIHHDHTIPTLLGVRHHDSGKFVNALDSGLYQTMKGATYHHSKRGGLPSLLRSPSDADADNVVAHKPKLSVNKSSVSFHHPLTVSWSDGHSHSQHVRKSDVIALYCPADETDPTKFRDAARIKEARRTTRHLIENGEGEGVEGKSVEIPDNEWRIQSFPVVREETCEFRLWLRDDERASTADGANENEGTEEQQRAIEQHHYVLAATTGPFVLEHGMSTPTGLHLALTASPSEMMIHFTTGHAGIPVVEYGLSKEDLLSSGSSGGSGSKVHRREGASTTYAAADMCQSPANLTEPGKFVHPGHLHHVAMTRLDSADAEYFYRVGVERRGKVHWSGVHRFRSSPAVVGSVGSASQSQEGAVEPYSYVVYADQGAPGYGAKDGSQRITQSVRHEVTHNSIRAVHHFGDLSYANGAGHMWDAWVDMVSQFAASVPLMVGVGNHEYDHDYGGGYGRDPSGVVGDSGFEPEWGNFHSDSNGECGVPTSKRFNMPEDSSGGNGSNGVFWYSYNVGFVHTVMISSEHDLSLGSEQYDWLELDLMGVDRTKTPFVIVESHRPLYNSEDVPANTMVSIAMRDEIEDLLVDYGVDMVLAGHYHAYLRTCSGLYQSKCDNGGPVHVTVGSAGAELDQYPLYEQDWTEYFGREWGYGRITVLNEKELKFEFVAEDDGELVVRDEVWIRKD